MILLKNGENNYLKVIRMSYFKFKAFSEDNDFALDMIRDKRIYMGTYLGQNDNREGHYWASLDANTKAIIRETKKHIRFGCLTTSYQKSYMWGEYANGGDGICIECDLVDRHFNATPISYREDLPRVNHESLSYNTINQIAKKILSCKLLTWRNDNEIRVFLCDESIGISDISINSPYFPIEIHKVYIGWNVSAENKAKVLDACAGIHLPSNCIIDMQEEWLQDDDLDVQFYYIFICHNIINNGVRGIQACW